MISTSSEMYKSDSKCAVSEPDKRTIADATFRHFKVLTSLRPPEKDGLKVTATASKPFEVNKVEKLLAVFKVLTSLYNFADASALTLERLWVSFGVLSIPQAPLATRVNRASFHRKNKRKILTDFGRFRTSQRNCDLSAIGTLVHSNRSRMLRVKAKFHRINSRSSDWYHNIANAKYSDCPQPENRRHVNGFISDGTLNAPCLL